MKEFDVVAICNALIDILVQVEESDIERLEIQKGIMHLVDGDRQKFVLEQFLNKPHTIELGGSALNAMRAIAGMGGKTAFAGMIGKDKFGHKITDRLDQLGIKSHLKETDEPTGSCGVLVTPDGERTMNTCLGASRLFDETLVPADYIANTKVFHFCGYQWDTDGQKRAIYKAIELAKKSGALVSFDVADPFVISRHKADFITMIERDADIVFANKEEATMLYDTTPEEAVGRIVQTGATAVVKLGGEGAILGNSKEVVRVAAHKVNVVDTTAAGDVFAGGFLHAFTKGESLKVCGETATLLAADVISRVGTTVSDAVLKQASKS